MTRTGDVLAPAGTQSSRPARRWIRPAGWVTAAAALFACLLRLSQTRAVNSDGAGNTLQAWDMLHGNLLLHGWQLTDVSFYTTELPQYMLVTAVTGLTSGVVHIAAAMTMTLLIILAGLLSRQGRARNLAGPVLAAGLLLTPQLGPGVNILLSSPDHLGTAVPVLTAWLILDRARPRPATAAAVGLVLGWAQVADPLVFWIGVLPLAGVGLLRGLLGGGAGSRRYEFALAAAALAGSALAAAAVRAISAAGGFRAAPVHLALVKQGHLAGNLAMTGRGLLLLFGADFTGARPGLATALAVAHLAGVAAAAWALWLAARHFRRGGDRVVQVVLAGVAIDLAAYLVSDRPHALPATREIDVILPLCAALAGRLVGPKIATWLGREGPAGKAGLAGEILPAGAAVPAGAAGRADDPRQGTADARVLALGTRLRRHPAARFAAGFAAGLVLAGYLASLATGLTRPAASAQYHRLGAWLAARHLRDGLAGYWAANVVTADTGGQVRIRPVSTYRGRLAAGRWAADTAWYDPRRASADYVVLSPGLPGYPGFTPRRQVLATFGRPARVYHAAGCLILLWHRNLLVSLGKAQFQNSKGSSIRSPARKPGSSSGSRPG